jgi:hypothetical protein
MKGEKRRVETVLKKLAREAGDALVAAVAGALALPEKKETAATISAATDQLVAQGRSPAAIIDALVHIDEQLLASGAVRVPFATHWATLAAERAIHAEKSALQESIDQELAESAPLFFTERSTLVAVPAGPLEEEGVKRFADRVLIEVMRQGPRRVLLVLHDGNLRDKKLSRQYEELVSDLEAQKIEVGKLVLRPRNSEPA